MNDILEFEDVFGFPFGTHGIKTVYVPGREAIIHVRTGAMSEDDVRFRLGSSIPGFGTPMAGVFAESLDAEEGLNFNSMYMTEDGVDPRSKLKTGHAHIPRKPRENAALYPHRDYYLRIRVTKPGHADWDPKMPVTYFGTDYTGEHVIEDLAGPSEPPPSTEPTPVGSVEMIIEGIPGKWTPNE